MKVTVQARDWKRLVRNLRKAREADHKAVRAELCVGMKFGFVLEGQPVPKQRARKGKGGHWYTPEQTKRFEAALAWAARAKVPRGWPTNARYRVTSLAFFTDDRGDGDNVLKSVLDALNPKDGGLPFVWIDDRRVDDTHAGKRIDAVRPRTEVTIEVIG